MKAQTELRAEYTHLPVSSNSALSRFLTRFCETGSICDERNGRSRRKTGDVYRAHQPLLQYLKKSLRVQASKTGTRKRLLRSQA